MPAFCRVAATLTPTKESDIKIEVWLPMAGWNGKLQAVGNGGWNGNIDTNALAGAVRRGYAGTSTDTGHQGGAGPWLQNPEKLTDWAYRSVHETAVAAKALINAFYGEAPKFSYFTGCSAGGRQAMVAAQRYPADFDGVVAGSPGLDWTSRAVSAVRVNQAFERDPAAKVPAAKFAAINAAVMDKCDALDGVKDGVLENPKACTFDPAVLACKGTPDNSCLTPPEIDDGRRRSTPRRPTRRASARLPASRRRQRIVLDRSRMERPGPRAPASSLMRFVANDPQWTIAQFNFDADVVRAEEKAGMMNALDTNLKPFFDRGGKMIQYHGWNDPQISPLNSTQYYDRVVKAMGGANRVSSNYRLFMVPGMAHCGGGTGTATFDMLTALEQWVEGKKAPESIPASRPQSGKVVRTRPLCAYPQVATYKGSGSTDDAANFVCK